MPGAERLRDLDGEAAHAARGAVDEDALARLEVPVVAHRLECGQACDRHRRGFLEGEIRRASGTTAFFAETYSAYAPTLTP